MASEIVKKRPARRRASAVTLVVEGTVENSTNIWQSTLLTPLTVITELASKEVITDTSKNIKEIG